MVAAKAESSGGEIFRTMPTCPNCGPIGYGPHSCDLKPKAKAPKPSKYRNKPTEVDGIRFDSKLEAKYYDHLKLCQQAGELLFFLRQTPFHLSCGTKYVVDFVEFWKDGSTVFTDVKGTETPVFKIKKRMVENEYSIKLNIVKKV